MSDSADDANQTAPVPRITLDDVRDTALEHAVDLDDDHLPRDTAPLDGATMESLKALMDEDDDDEQATDEFDLSGLALDESISDDTLTDAVASSSTSDSSEG